MKLTLLQACIDILRGKISLQHLKRIIYSDFLSGRKINYQTCNFSEVISLGYNCEVSMRFRDIFKNFKFSHFLFTWSYERDRELFLKALCDLENFAQSEYSVLSNGMIKHEKYNIAFHSRYAKNELLDNGHTASVVSAIEELKSRLEHLGQKMLNVLKEKDNVLFVLKLKYFSLRDDLEYVEKINEIIGEFFKKRNAKYLILVVLSEKDYPQDCLKMLMQKEIQNVKIETVKSFANDSYTDTDGDLLGWYKVLKKYIKDIK